MRAMAWQFATGLVFTAGLCVRPDLAISFAPIVAPLLFAAPLAVFTSRRSVGERLAAAGFLMTPDEHGVSATPVAFRGPVKPVTPVQAQEAFSTPS